MKTSKKIFSLFSAALIFAGTAVAQVSSSDSEAAFKLLDATDKQLAYHGDYSATISLVVEKPGKPTENVQFKIFERTDKELMTLVQLRPEADKGKGYLRDGDNIWAYDPIGRKFSHSSLKESLADSDVNISDVNRTESTWRKNYNVTEYKSGTLGKYEVYIITLTAKTTEPSYSKSTYYIRKDVNLLLKEEDFSSSGRLMRTVLLPKYTKVPAGYVATQVILKDEINKGENTQQVITDLSFDTLPNNIFTKSYLENLN